MSFAPSRRFEPTRPDLPALPDEVIAEIDRAHDVAEALAADGVRIRVCRLGPPRHLRIDLLADDAVLCALTPAELLELGAGRLHVSR